VYKSVNGKSCGDVLQSLLHVNKQFFLVMNNSGKVIVTDEEFRKTAEINGLSSPRYLLKVTDAKAYLSDLQANKISIIHLKDHSLKGSIACRGWTEQMALVYNKVFVTNLSSRYLYVINSMTDAISDSVEVGSGAASLVSDADDQLWVLCRGDQAKKEKACLLQIDPISLLIRQRVSLEGAPSNLCVGPNGRDLYYLNAGVWQYDSKSAQSRHLYGEATSNFYGLGIHPVNGDIFVSDAMDYAQASTIIQLSKEGTRKKSLKAGINTGGFYFE
jgi:DNA-binding beta-propeller fold protein YncE